MIKFFSQLFCSHSFLFHRNIYGDEIIKAGYNRSLWRCHKCGKWKFKPYLYEPELKIFKDEKYLYGKND
jgi:hypothetical protein